MNLHFTPQSLVIYPGKNDSLVWDGSVSLPSTSTPLNDITRLSNESPILYGTFFDRHLSAICNLLLHQLDGDILIFDDDVKSCFSHEKINLGIVTTFSFILQQFICVPIDQIFSSNTSHSNWEPFARARCLLAKVFFHDDSLVRKHNALLLQVRFSAAASSEVYLYP